jgi:hypothetical protein
LKCKCLCRTTKTPATRMKVRKRSSEKSEGKQC